MRFWISYFIFYKQISSYNFIKVIQSKKTCFNCQISCYFKGSHSEVCKYELFRDWIEIYKLNKHKHLITKPQLEATQEYSYHLLKKSAVEYQTAKLQVLKQISWIFFRNPIFCIKNYLFLFCRYIRHLKTTIWATGSPNRSSKTTFWSIKVAKLLNFLSVKFNFLCKNQLFCFGCNKFI